MFHMKRREINEAQARAVLHILKEECLFVADGADAEGFIHTVRTDLPRGQVCDEYRLVSGLGYGGKFRNNGNKANVPYVDCYPEDETPVRLAMMERANKRLAYLFDPDVKA